MNIFCNTATKNYGKFEKFILEIWSLFQKKVTNFG